MAAEEMCLPPLMCRTRTGECCEVTLFEGRVVCPFSCNLANRQSNIDQFVKGFSLNSIFKVTLVTTAFYNIISELLTPSSTAQTTTPISTTTTTTTTTTPTMTTCKNLTSYSNF